MVLRVQAVMWEGAPGFGVGVVGVGCVPVPPFDARLCPCHAGRINSSEVLLLWNWGLFDLLFSKINAHCFFWEPDPPGQLRWRCFRASLAAHTALSPMLFFPCISPNRGHSEVEAISHCCLLHP